MRATPQRIRYDVVLWTVVLSHRLFQRVLVQFLGAVLPTFDPAAGEVGDPDAPLPSPRIPRGPRLTWCPRSFREPWRAFLVMSKDSANRSAELLRISNIHRGFGYIFSSRTPQAG